MTNKKKLLKLYKDLELGKTNLNGLGLCYVIINEIDFFWLVISKN